MQAPPAWHNSQPNLSWNLSSENLSSTSDLESKIFDFKSNFLYSLAP